MGIEKYLSKIENKSNANQIRNVDYIYLINLDKCVERFEYCMEQFIRCQIRPHRVSAVYGKELPQEAFDHFGVKLKPNQIPNWEMMWCVDQSKPVEERRYVYKGMGKGAIGCFLSHLSILVDALESGYERIWILEDDILIKEDPRCLSEYIDRLDSLVGWKGWDVLYTDAGDVLPQFEGKIYRRPDLLVDYENLPVCEKVGEDFYRIGGRCGTNSMIVSREGIKRIVGYYSKYNFFNGYDQELSLIPGIRLFNLIPGPVCNGLSMSPSDTLEL